MSQYIQISSAQRQPALGQIKNIEGELIITQVKDASSFELGQKVVCTYRSFEFESSVLRIKENQLYLYFPLKPNKLLNDRRRTARVNVDMKAVLMLNTQSKAYDVHHLQMLDVSVLGFSFVTKDDFPIGSICTILPQSDQLPIKAEIKIKNQEVLDSGYRFGTEIKHITPNHFHVLRKFVLAQQLTGSNDLPFILENE